MPRCLSLVLISASRLDLVARPQTLARDTNKGGDCPVCQAHQTPKRRANFEFVPLSLLHQRTTFRLLRTGILILQVCLIDCFCCLSPAACAFLFLVNVLFLDTRRSRNLGCAASQLFHKFALCPLPFAFASASQQRDKQQTALLPLPRNSNIEPKAGNHADLRQDPHGQDYHP